MYVCVCVCVCVCSNAEQARRGTTSTPSLSLSFYFVLHQEKVVQFALVECPICREQHSPSYFLKSEWFISAEGSFWCIGGSSGLRGALYTWLSTWSSRVKSNYNYCRWHLLKTQLISGFIIMQQAIIVQTFSLNVSYYPYNHNQELDQEIDECPVLIIDNTSINLSVRGRCSQWRVFPFMLFNLSIIAFMHFTELD